MPYCHNILWVHILFCETLPTVSTIPIVSPITIIHIDAVYIWFCTTCEFYTMWNPMLLFFSNNLVTFDVSINRYGVKIYVSVFVPHRKKNKIMVSSYLRSWIPKEIILNQKARGGEPSDTFKTSNLICVLEWVEAINSPRGARN